MSVRFKRSWALLPIGLLVLGMSGCGQNTGLRNPQVPLVDGAHVVQQIRRCDEGSDVFCALDMVVANPRYRSSGEFLKDESKHLKDLGWSLQAGEIGQEQSAVSPGRKLRIVYATAAGDLLALDLGWIQRPSPIGLTLAKTMFDRVPAISLIVEAGPA
jgi:hypothetical protein